MVRPVPQLFYAADYCGMQKLLFLKKRNIGNIDPSSLVYLKNMCASMCTGVMLYIVGPHKL